MYLYDVIPENLFSVLASKNKALYVEALFVLLDAFKQHLKIPKDELISMIISKSEDRIINADFSDEELLESEHTLSGKAHFLVRKLKNTGWIIIETENDFKEYVTVPSYSYRIIQLLSDISNATESENFTFVYSTYSSFKIADETHDIREMITALNDGAERTEKLVESLKSVYHSITYYNQLLIDTLNVNNVLHSHYDRYQEEIVSRIMRPLKIKDSVPKYKIPIQQILKKWLVEDETIEALVEYLKANNDSDYEECRNEILRKIYFIIETYDSLEKDFISVIDRKNRRYTQATTQKIDYLINSDQTVKGNLIYLLKSLSSERSEEICDNLSDMFELYEQTYIDCESLYERKRAVRRNKNAELIMTDDLTDFKAKAKAMAMEIMNSKYSKRNVADFVENILGEKNEVSTADFEITDDDTYIFTLLSVVQANDRNSCYTAEIIGDNIKLDKYQIPHILYKRVVKE